MADNVIRRDVIELGFKVIDDGLAKANKQMDDLKKSFSGDIEKGFDKIKKTVNDTNESIKGFGKKSGIDDMAKSTARFTKTFQSVNRSIQDGGNALAKFKSKITSLPHNTVNKISDGFVKMRLNAAIAAGALKNVAQTKFNNLKADIKATKQALTEGQAQKVSEMH